MIDTAARDFLQKPLIARFATLSPDGYPHNVPVWFMLEGNDIILISDRKIRKVKNALQHPKGTVTIGGDISDGAGYMIQGELSIEEDPDKAVTHRMIDRYESPEKAAEFKELWKNDDIIVIRLKPVKVVKVWG
ncbi:MAG TPA: pyridoxamine 5'-phosphate oxidase family protein [Aggregatilineales bacterium]|nr:pyridoxamine 5'-phosphate oxidase family protein [Aggregatilineales bacterium]